MKTKAVGPVSRCRCVGRRMLLLAAALLAAFSAAPEAGAQGAADALPKPINTGELVRYMEQLELSDQQQMAVMTMHDEYKAWFRSLYDDGLDEFLDEMRNMGGFRMPTRDEMNDIVQGLRRYEGRIRALDNRLFDQMQTVLTDEQLAEMPRVRLARQRTTYKEQPMLQMWTMGTPIIDLSAVVADLELDEQHREAIDPLLARYESKLTGRMATLHNSATDLWMDIYDALETEGFNPESMEEMAMENPEELQRMMEVVQNIFMELTAKGREDVSDLRAMNRQTLRSFEGLVPQDVQRTIRNGYYARAYPRIAMMTRQMPVGTAVLERLTDASDEQKQQAADAIRIAMTQLDAVISEAVDRIDDFREHFNFMDFDPELFEKHNEELNALTSKATEIADTLNQRLSEILSAEQLQQWQQAMAELSRSTSPMSGGELIVEAQQATEAAEEAEAGDAAADEQAVYMQQMGSDQFLPPAISTHDVAVYAKLLDINEDQRTIINELHKDYQKQFDAVEENEVAKVHEAQQSVWSGWGEDFDPAAARSSINAAYEHRRTAMEAIRNADNAFFDNVALVLPEQEHGPLLDHVRKLRHRQRLNRQAGGWFAYMPFDQSRESAIDVVGFAARQWVDPDVLLSLGETLTAYENAAAPLLQQRYDASMESQKRQELWSLRWRELQETEGGAAANAATFSEFNEQMSEFTSQLAEADRQLAELNSTTMDALLTKLPAGRSRTVRDAYNRRAFPGAFNDEQAASKYIDKAAELSDLSASQRATLADLRAEYQPAYEENRMKLLELIRNAPQRQMNVVQTDADEIKNLQEYQDKLGRLKFERHELNSRALLRLRQLLNEQQISAIGGLPELSERQDMDPVYW